jgi:hypothetical protein
LRDVVVIVRLVDLAGLHLKGHAREPLAVVHRVGTHRLVDLKEVGDPIDASAGVALGLDWGWYCGHGVFRSLRCAETHATLQKC